MSSKDNGDSEQSQILLTVSEVAKILRCSKAHVHNLINDTVKGGIPIPAIAVGGRRLVSRTALDEWVLKTQFDPTKTTRRASRKKQHPAVVLTQMPAAPSVGVQPETGFRLDIPAEAARSIGEIAQRRGTSIEAVLSLAIETLKRNLESRN
jgi:excisionase family DNA binding protein